MNKLTLGQSKLLRLKELENRDKEMFWRDAELARRSAFASSKAEYRECKDWYRKELEGIRYFRRVMPIPG